MTAPRVLLLVSNDFGELTNALAFARGCGPGALLLLPEKLSQLNPGALDVRHLAYRDSAHAAASIEAQAADALLLFSGYLLVINQLFDLPGLTTLLARARMRGVRVATSDPFLGLLSAGQSSPFHPRHPAKAWMDQHFSRVGALMAPYAHLYTGAADLFPAPRALSFSDPAMGAAASPLPSSCAEQPVWLFILAGDDMRLQLNRHGPAFAATVARRLADAHRAHAAPVLLAPPELVDAVRAQPDAPSFSAHTACSLAAFKGMLDSAQYVFFWNMISNSILPRLFHRRPVVFYDHGHLVHTVPALFRLVCATYFAGHATPMADAAMTLTPEWLARQAASQSLMLEAASGHLRALPPPQVALQAILAGLEET